MMAVQRRGDLGKGPGCIRARMRVRGPNRWRSLEPHVKRRSGRCEHGDWHLSSRARVPFIRESMSKSPHRPRPSLPASSTEFALRASSSPLQSPSDDFALNPLLFRFRRPSLLVPKYLSDSRLSSPLATSFTAPLRPSSASDVDRERIWADSGSTSESSENATPPLNGSEADKDAGADSDTAMKTSRPQTPPPRNPSSSSMDVIAESSYLPQLRRLSHPVRHVIHLPITSHPNLAQTLTSMRRILQLKLPRILNLVQESSRPDENEVKSEAQFQRLVASFSELPMQPRTTRVPSDRGRYPEEVSEGRGTGRCQTPSDDSDYDEADGIPFAFPQTTQEPITIRTRTPAASVSGSLCGDDMIYADSPGAAMDIDAVGVCSSSYF
jgi:hypothetical protein